MINLARKTPTAFLLTKEIQILDKYLDYTNVFFE